MKVFGILLFLFAIAANASDPITRKPIQIEHLNVDYNNKVGHGDVQYMTYHFDNMSLDHKNLKANLEFKDGTLSITDGMTKFSISKVLDFLNLFDSIQAADLNFYLKDSFFTGAIPRSFVGLTGRQYLLQQFAVDCGSKDRDVEDPDDTLLLILEMCFGKARIALDEMTFPQTDTPPLLVAAEDVLNEALNATAKVFKFKIDRIRNFAINFDDHEFNAHAKVKVLLDLGIHASGRVDYEPTHARHRVELKSASVGFIGVKKFIFRALKNMNDPNILVEEPYIYINYKKSPNSKSTKLAGE